MSEEMSESPQVSEQPTPQMKAPLGSVSEFSSMEDLSHRTAADVTPMASHEISSHAIDPASHKYSRYNVFHWRHLPHFHYRRLFHELFSLQHLYHPEWLPRGSSIAAAANMVSCTIGVGTLAHPFAMESCGVAVYIVLSAVTVFFTLFSIYLLCKCVDATQLHSFEMMTRHLFNSRKLELLVEAFMILNCFGTATAYIVVIGDITQQVGQSFAPSLATETGRMLSQLVVFLVIMLPLSLLRTVGALKYASIVGIIAIAALITFVSYEGLAAGTTSNLVPRVAGNPSSILSGLPLIFFGFSNQLNAVEIYSEMNPRSPKEFTWICFYAVGLVWIAYTLVAFGGLAVFGTAVQGNVLKSFGALGLTPFAAIAFLGIFLKVVLTYPLIQFPSREAVLHLLGVHDVRNCSTRMFTTTTVVLSGAAFTVAIFVPTVTVLFGVLGAVCSSLFAFILPVIFAERMPDVVGSEALLKPLMRAMLGFGVAGGVVGTVFSILSIV